MIRSIIPASAAASGVSWHDGKAYDTLPIEVRVQRLERLRNAELDQRVERLMRDTKPFIDNKRGATMRHQAHKEDPPKPFYRSQVAGLLVFCIALALLLTACASPYNHPGIPRTPDPAYEGWGDEQ